MSGQLVVLSRLPSVAVPLLSSIVQRLHPRRLVEIVEEFGLAEPNFVVLFECSDRALFLVPSGRVGVELRKIVVVLTTVLIRRSPVAAHWQMLLLLLAVFLKFADLLSVGVNPANNLTTVLRLALAARFALFTRVPAPCYLRS